MVQPSLDFDRPQRETLTDKMGRYFRSREGSWLDVMELAAIGGIGGWRTRVSECVTRPTAWPSSTACCTGRTGATGRNTASRAGRRTNGGWREATDSLRRSRSRPRRRAIAARPRYRAEVAAPVLDLSRVGGGCPDLLVAGGPVGDAVLCEVKSRLNTGGTRGLSSGQRTFMQDWPARTAVLWDAEDAVCLGDWGTATRPPGLDHRQGDTAEAGRHRAGGGLARDTDTWQRLV